MPCSFDCPYGAIDMIRIPERDHEVARVDPTVCVSCGICAGSCAPMAVGPPERRGRDEVANFGARPVVPEGVPVRHPAFDVTPARLVTAIVTERGLARPPSVESVRALAP